MHIDLNYNPLRCTDNFVLWNGIPCPFTVVFILDRKLDTIELVSKKITVKTGIKCLELSFGTNQNISYPEIDFSNLKQSESLIKPPFACAPLGCLAKEQMTRDKRIRSTKKE